MKPAQSSRTLALRRLLGMATVAPKTTSSQESSRIYSPLATRSESACSTMKPASRSF
jgi:hypothetical protein